MKRTTVVLLAASALGLGAALLTLTGTPQAAKEFQAAYAPEQPLPAFSHEVHATGNEMDCQYCHIYARRSRSSGVPPVQTCYNCHKVVDQSTVSTISDAGNADIMKIREAYQTGDPIEWVKVHDTQDFVKFTHRAHILIGEELGKVGDEGFTCQNCHGPVEQMGAAVLREWDPELNEQPLTMGWCLTCHINKSADAALVEKLKLSAHGQGVEWESLIGQVEVSQTEVDHTKARLRDCLTCHY